MVNVCSNQTLFQHPSKPLLLCVETVVFKTLQITVHSFDIAESIMSGSSAKALIHKFMKYVLSFLRLHCTDPTQIKEGPTLLTRPIKQVIDVLYEV